MGVKVTTDSNGFRSSEIPEKAPPGVARIAFVGDSTTLGWGVAQNETAAARVTAALVAEGRKVDSYNTGVGNHNTLQELTLFRETAAAGDAVTGNPGENGAGGLLGGALELSNVSAVEEMIDLISGQRAYEVNTRVIKAADEMLGQTAQLR